jgi:serine/threonine protein kinase
MGLVWLAHDEHLQEDMALKFLPETVRLDAVSIEELKRETRRSRRLAHANIIRVFDFASDATSAAISMEFVAGQTLSGLRARRENLCFEEDEIREWMRQFLAALAYAHEDAKIVHRDLKPANVMVDQSGRVKVADFGIASSISESVSRVTMQRSTSGTLAFMSPQQVMGEGPAVTDDIYSVGAMIFELLTSKPPFYTGDIPGQIRDKVPSTMRQRREALGIQGAVISEDWESAVAACLAKDASDRPASANELAVRLGLEHSAATKQRAGTGLAFPKRKYETERVEIPPLGDSTTLLTQRANGNDVRAQVELAYRYLEGKGVPRDPEVALDWFIRAAELRDREAQTQVGKMYQEGIGTPRDPGLALGWFQEAASRGGVEAMTQLGTMYERGDGVSRQVERALEWFTRAAREGSQDAIRALRKHGR